MTAYANLDGFNLVSVMLQVPNVGPWWADIVFELAPEFSDGASVTLNIGTLALTGTLRDNGTFGEQRRARVVAGAGGWATLVASQHYHSDGVVDSGGGIAARTIADDAARIAGETIGTFVVSVTRIGIDYVREAGVASRVLEDVIGNTPWHVDFEGKTNVGERATVQANARIYQVLDFDPRESLVTLAVDDIAAIGIGSIISEGLDQPETIYEMQVEVTADSSRVIAWLGGTLSTRGRLAELFRGIIKRSTDDKLFGLFQYRVTGTPGDRLELQIVNQDGRMPDAIPLSMQPGVAGAHAKLTDGSIVLVQFIDGLRTMPVVTHFAGKDTEGHVTDELDFSVATTLRLGSDSASEGVTLGDSHKSWADGHKHGPGSFTTTVGSGGGGGAVSGLSDGPDSPAPDPSTKVKVE